MAEFEAEIKEILAQSDINTVSAKKVRTALEERHGISLKERKQEIDKLILKCFDALQEEDVEEEELSTGTPKKRVKKSSGDESLSEVEDTPKKKPRKTPTKKRTKKADPEEKEKKPRAANPNSGFNKPYLLSPLLAEIVGAEELPRPEVTKRIWQYIKERDLQDPQDKRYIACDEKLKEVFETDRVHMFTMNKLLSQHLKDKPVEATAETAAEATVDATPKE
ncbi:SWIB-domain-containing protein [Basidiobolus meristosporus CBS 931.73]|uniref:SWIB-domain-containing protein n=1 Tax=Basidiobolus meristosporus CBS 931.73 TaxID=1314790 RepID=A0A1Y1Y1C3_9FUNG|nr:SWIB-domain-containing protein [Basidiobolus meristosporus CBS 931.73]|eukprot:ORX91807.1 SWIB-domain-containing protein [Basidiobolus meristosporus CBS 931.73]